MSDALHVRDWCFDDVNPGWSLCCAGRKGWTTSQHMDQTRTFFILYEILCKVKAKKTHLNPYLFVSMVSLFLYLHFILSWFIGKTLFMIFELDVLFSKVMLNVNKNVNKKNKSLMVSTSPLLILRSVFRCRP